MLAAGAAALVAHLLYDWVVPDAGTRRLQDFNRRIIFLVTHPHDPISVFL